MELRRLFITAVQIENASFEEICEEFNISRKTGYKWWKRYQLEGTKGLFDRSRRPRTIYYGTSEKVVEPLVALRKQYPKWGARKLCRLLKEQGLKIPPERTANRILSRQGLVVPRPSHPPAATQFFEREAPNELWQMDHKAAIHLSSWERVVPFVVLDDHSRYLLGLVAQPNKGTIATWGSLWKIFQTFGLPQQILSDNDMVFHADIGPSQIEAKLMRLGIQVYHGRPYHPQTQGKVEKLNGTLQLEALQDRKFNCFEEVQETLDRFRECYNYVRPHDSLGLDSPGQHYRPSTRPCPSFLPEMNYGDGCLLRKVGSRGLICWKGWYLFIGRGLSGEWVELREQESGVEIYYGPYLIHRLGVQYYHPARKQK